MPRDRFENTIQCFTKDARFFVANEPCITAAKAVTLLRREHAAITRAVKRLQQKYICMAESPVVALDDVLALLERRRKV